MGHVVRVVVTYSLYSTETVSCGCKCHNLFYKESSHQPRLDLLHVGF